MDLYGKNGGVSILSAGLVFRDRLLCSKIAVTFFVLFRRQGLKTRQPCPWRSALGFWRPHFPLGKIQRLVCACGGGGSGNQINSSIFVHICEGF